MAGGYSSVDSDDLSMSANTNNPLTHSSRTTKERDLGSGGSIKHMSTGKSSVAGISDQPQMMGFVNSKSMMPGA